MVQEEKGGDPAKMTAAKLGVTWVMPTWKEIEVLKEGFWNNMIRDLSCHRYESGSVD